MVDRRSLSCVCVALAAWVVNAAPAHGGGKANPGPMVPAFARFHADGKADLAEGGRLLFKTLNCGQCHSPGDVEPNPAKSAPILDGVGLRVKHDYLKQFLNNPHGMKPGTTMPDLFAGVDAAEKQATVEALVHFLASTGTPAHVRPDRKGVASGRELYHQVGCVACHGTRDANGDQDKTFAGTVALGNVKAKYSLASLKTFLENPHQTRPNGRMPGLLNAKEAGDVANYLMQGIAGAPSAVNMSYAYYEGSWQNVPDFNKLKPVAAGNASDFDLGVARRLNDCGVKFDGFVKIDNEGKYTFHLMSDDGSKLWIDGKLVVDNDGVHPPQSKSGSAKLTKGMHKLTVSVFNAGGGFELGVEVEGPGVGRQPLGPMVQLMEKTEVPVVKGNNTERFTIQPELVAKGKELFASAGCANCHAMQNETKRVAAPALAKLKAEGGCVAAAPAKGLPWYGLSATQQTALRAVIEKPAAQAGVREAVAFTMKALNCYACHEREKIGGVEDDVNKAFVTVQPEMGDEGRLPPALNGVGAKLKTEYLKKVLEQGAHDRPYMHTRMPRFGGNASHLVALFESLDAPEPSPKVATKEPAPKLKSAGRHLVGAQAFGCIKCHTFAGAKAEGVQGIDMAIMTQRVKHDWFHNYMINPTAYRPGTRMPSSFPDGKTLLKKVLDGQATTQIEAIWLYLADGAKANLPLGMNKQSIPLIPTTEAIIYRNFIQGAGPRAIGVGYPEKAHLAFDANEMRLAMLWQGGFIDARRHWTGRGEGFEPPMGDNILHLPAGVSFAVLGSAEEAWPTKPAKEQGYRFRGYRLSDDQRPTFLYSYKDILIEDFPNAVETKASPGIRRVFTVQAKAGTDNLYFRAAVGDKIEALGDGWYRLNDLRIRIEAPGMPMLRQSGAKMELLVPVRFQGDAVKIVQEFAW